MRLVRKHFKIAYFSVHPLYHQTPFSNVSSIFCNIVPDSQNQPVSLFFFNYKIHKVEDRNAICEFTFFFIHLCIHLDSEFCSFMQCTMTVTP